MNKGKNREYFIFVVITMIACGMVAVFSASTSVLYPECYVESGNQFSITSIIIGRGWTEGMVPYRDLFGTDGPLFYLIEAIGWGTLGRNGLMVLQMLACTFAGILLYILGRRYVGKAISFGLSMAGLGIIAAGGGLDNSAQLYLLLISLGMLYWYSEREKKLTMFGSVLCGIVFAISIMFQIKSAFWILAIFAAVMIKERKKGYIWRRMIGFVFGFTAGILPVAIYFFANDALAELVDGAFLFNFKSMGLGFGSMNEIIRKAIKCVPAVIVLLLELFVGKCREEKEPLWILTAILAIVFLFTGNGWWTCYILLCPFLVYSVSIMDFLEGKKGVIAGGLLLLSFLAVFAVPLKNRITDLKNNVISGAYQSADERVRDWCSSSMKEGEKSLAIDITAAYYMTADQMPAFRLFDHQSEWSAVDSKYSVELLEYIAKDEVDWLCIRAGGILNQWYGNYAFQNFIELYDITGVYYLDLLGETEHIH